MTRDPFRKFLDSTAKFGTESKWLCSGEHKWVGDEGAERALQARGIPKEFGPFARKNAREELTYGEIVAFSGDFYESPEALFNEGPSLVPWLYQETNISELLEVFRKEVDWIEEVPSLRKSGYPDESLALWWYAKHYVRLCLHNTTHFGWHNALMYAQWHEKALELAKQYASATNPEERKLVYRRAIYTNAFADHFLTDCFVAGHVRTPAKQIRRWAEKKGLSTERGGALLKLIHDHDGHIETKHGQKNHQKAGGLRVTNSQGAEWLTRSDGQLFLDGVDKDAIEMVVSAVQDSVGELLDMFDGKKEPPTGVYEAALRIPWPHPEEETLVERFPSSVDDVRLDALCEGIEWYVQIPFFGASIIRPKHIRELFTEMPTLMKCFRDDVAEDMRNSPYMRHLPSELINGYREVK